MGGRRLATLVVCMGALLAPSSALATTVTLGPSVPTTPGSSSLSCNEFGPGCTAGFTVAQFTSLHLDEVPADGTITTWRISGEDHVTLHVLREGEEEGSTVFGEGVSAPATNLEGGANATSLPVHAGDLIGVDLGGSGGVGGLVFYAEQPGSELLFFNPSPPAFGAGIPEVRFDKEVLVNADVVLAPVVTAVSPAQGPAAGGNSVSISGLDLDGATGVSFGAVPAKSFTVGSASQITAVAPASVAGQVDVHVTGPGGTSATAEADRYTFTPSSTGSPAPGNGSPSTGQVAKPAVTALGQTASRWRRGGKLPRISRAGVPVGTTFSFTLNGAANASFAFSRKAAGRRVKGQCVAVTPGNSRKRHCTRRLSAGGFSLPAHAGVNKVFFQGRLSKAKSLSPGTYTLVVTAHSAGVSSSSRPLSFTIVS